MHQCLFSLSFPQCFLIHLWKTEVCLVDQLLLKAQVFIMQCIWIDLFRAVKAIIILTLDFTLLFKSISRISPTSRHHLSYLRLASMEHVSAQLPSVRNCPEREREKEDKRGENIMKCQQLKWITVQYQSRHSEKGKWERIFGCGWMLAWCRCFLNCSFCFSISGEVLSWLISSAVDVWRDDVLGKWTVAVSLERIYLRTLRGAYTNIWPLRHLCCLCTPCCLRRGNYRCSQPVWGVSGWAPIPILSLCPSLLSIISRVNNAPRLWCWWRCDWDNRSNCTPLHLSLAAKAAF